MRIFLVGYMGSGKTSTGKLLARGLGYEFMDIDELFEGKYKISIQDFFKKYDESAFRKLEHDLLEETIQRDNIVYSMGGGTPCFYDNMDILKRNGLTVYIKMPTKALFQRLQASKKRRPVLHGLSDDELLGHIHDQLMIREMYYSQAELTVEGINLDIEALIRIIKAHHAMA
jgi:shikimate kinase